MSQGFKDTPSTEKVRDSRPKLLARDEALRSEFSGAAFPALNTPEAGDAAPVDGQRHFNTTNLRTYQRRGAQWVETADTPAQATAAALRALDAAATIPDGRAVSLLGIAALGDCMPFTLVWSAASTATHDGHSVFRPTAGAAATGAGRWLRTRLSEERHLSQLGAKFDGRTVFDGAMSQGGNVLTSTAAGFTDADVGKWVIVADAITPVGFSMQFLAAQIASRSGNTVTLAGGVTCTKTGGVANAEVIVASDDSAAFALAVALGGTWRLPAGRSIVTQPINFSNSWVRFVGQSGLHHVQDLNYFGNPGAPGTTGLAKSLSKSPTVISWAGALNVAMTTFLPGQVDGTWVTHQGNGLEGVTLDCAGRAAAGVQVRTQGALVFERVCVARYPGARGAITDPGIAYDIGVDDNFTNLSFVDCAYNRFINCTAVNRGTTIYGGKSLWLWGDKIRGNINYTTFAYCHWIVENDGNVYNCEIEQVDTTDFIGCVWNAKLRLHSAESPGEFGGKSLLNGYAAGREMLANPNSPANQTVSNVRPGYYKLSITGGTNVQLANGTATIVGGTKTATPGAPVEFEVATSGTLTLTISGSPSAISCRVVQRSGQSRTCTFTSCSGLVVLCGSLLNAQGMAPGGTITTGLPFAARNHIFFGYDLENINTLPLTEVAGNWNATVYTNAGPPQTNGALQYGRGFTGLNLTRGLDQSLASGVVTTLIFDYTASDTVELLGFMPNLLAAVSPVSGAATVTLPVGVYKLAMVGTGSVATTQGTGVGSGLGTASAGSDDEFTVTTAGTFTFTPSGSVNSWVLRSLTRFVVPSGIWWVTPNLKIYWGPSNNNTTGYRLLHIFVNGVLYDTHTRMANTFAYSPPEGLQHAPMPAIAVKPGDYFEFAAEHNAGATLTSLAVAGRAPYAQVAAL